MKNTTYKYNFYFFRFMVSILWILTILSLLGINSLNPTYLNTISYIIRIYVCFFLILRFNPFYSFFTGKKFTKLDKSIAYSAALVILTTDTNFIYFINKYVVENIKAYYSRITI